MKLKGVAATLKKENIDQKCNLSKRVIFFATGNFNKFREAKEILNRNKFATAMIRFKGVEIQSESLEEIARTAVKNAFSKTSLPVFVEDAGLFIEALDGFPGPYAAYVYKTVHNKGILKLMSEVSERQAKFRSVIAYQDQYLAEPKCFLGESKGKITKNERMEKGKSGFGFDPIFQPDGNDKTFAEMTVDEKNSYSHRATAVQKLAEWLDQRQG